jgi:hypothetical protein
MEKITPEVLRNTDIEDWRDFYLVNGQDILALAEVLLNSDNESDIDLGLSIINEAYFEEDEDNPDRTPSLAHLEFSGLISPLTKLVNDERYKTRAEKGLWIIDKEQGKKEGPMYTVALENLKSNSESKQRKGIEELIGVVKEDGAEDIALAIEYILENEEKLAMGTDAMVLVFLYYLKKRDYGELDKLLTRDEAASLRMYRGIAGSFAYGHIKKEDVEEFLEIPGVSDRLTEISHFRRAPSLDEFLK